MTDTGVRGRWAAAVLWDMDGTLVDAQRLWDIALYELAEELGGQLSAEANARMAGTSMAATLRMLFDELGLPHTEEGYADADKWLTARMRELYSDRLIWQPGAVDALRMVRAAGLPAAMVTTTVRELTELALDQMGREYFDATVCGDEVDGRNKPHPEPYLRAARLLGVDPAASVAVEDSPTGVASAEAAGCTVIVIPGEVPVEPGERRIFRPSLVGLRLDDLQITGPR